MSGRRAPLSSNPNAVNSPYRAVAAAAAAKQKRSYATTQREDSYGHPPPAKKQMLESHDTLRTPPRQQSTQSSAEGRVFTRKSNSTQPPTAFERKLAAVAVRHKTVQQPISKADKTSEENLETIRQWQKHYRRNFPKFVFYFESVSEDIRLKCTKQVTALGAREEKFFSNAVTHVVTTRSIPPEHDGSAGQSSTACDSQSQNHQLQTINPSLLDRSSEATNAQSDPFRGKGKFTFDVPMNRRPANLGHDADIRKQQGRNSDVLYRARELGMKIWALEKLQRMMTTMFEADTGLQVIHGHNTRSNSVQGNVVAPRGNREADLSQLLRNERIHGPSDRDPTVATKELNLFKGPFIYIHDIDERQKPIMVREYAKVSNKEDGDWPQFRSVAHGKCPFVEEVDKREVEREKEIMRLQRQQEKEKSMMPRTRGAAAVEASRMQPPKTAVTKRVLTDTDTGSNRNVTVTSKQTNPFEVPKMPYSHRAEIESSSRGQQNAFVSRAGTTDTFRGEPVASGVQPSNITSAIRSQMISSTAAQPGAKAGTSKEVHGLQRKVLEKNSGGPGSYGIASSHRMTETNPTGKDEMSSRPAKRKHEKLDLIEEDTGPSEQEENARKAEVARKAKAVQQRKLEKRDPKPGYCENCQDKFEDFDEHILSRKHRKFAEKVENWKDLDALLNQLARPLANAREVY